MKYLVGETSNGTAVYAVKGDMAIDLTALDEAVGQDLMAILSDPALADSVAARIDGAPQTPVASITPALPVAQPGTIICLGLNYTDHIKEGGYEIPEYPALFMRGRNSIMAAGYSGITLPCSCAAGIRSWRQARPSSDRPALTSWITRQS